MITRTNVVDHLIKQIPEFKVAYNEHLHDNFGEVLLHPLFADLTRFAIAMYRSSERSSEESSDSSETFERILDFIEEAAQSKDEMVVELVQLSFMENLHQAGPDYTAIEARLRPTSHQLLEAVGQG